MTINSYPSLTTCSQSPTEENGRLCVCTHATYSMHITDDLEETGGVVKTMAQLSKRAKSKNVLSSTADRGSRPVSRNARGKATVSATPTTRSQSPGSVHSNNNSHPNGRSAASHGPTHYFISKLLMLPEEVMWMMAQVPNNPFLLTMVQ